MSEDSTQAGDTFQQLSEDSKSRTPAWGRAIWTGKVTTEQGASYTTIELFDKEVVFGRKGTCQVKLSNAAISGQHCQLNRGDDGVILLKDLSTNGTWVDGKKVGKGNQVALQHDSEIVFLRTKEDRISYKLSLAAASRSADTNGGLDDKYIVGEILGTGAFAAVKLCVERATGKKFACKVIDKKKFQMQNGSGRANALMDEVKILQRLDHPRIIKIFDVFETDAHLFLILELVTGGDLFDRIANLKGAYPEDRARFLFTQMLEGVQYLHENSIVHRDLKPENILMFEKDSDDIKLSDFGLSRIVGEGSFMKTLCGTPQYLAPEVISDHKAAGTGYDKAVDLWSLGVILYILLSGAAPFKEGDHVLEQVKRAEYSFPDKLWRKVSPEGRELVARLMEKDPEKRITVERALDHPWTLGPAAAAAASRKRKAPDELKVPSGGASSSGDKDKGSGRSRSPAPSPGNGKTARSRSPAVERPDKKHKS